MYQQWGEFRGMGLAGFLSGSEVWSITAIVVDRVG